MKKKDLKRKNKELKMRMKEIVHVMDDIQHPYLVNKKDLGNWSVSVFDVLNEIRFLAKYKGEFELNPEYKERKDEDYRKQE